MKTVLRLMFLVPLSLLLGMAAPGVADELSFRTAQDGVVTYDPVKIFAHRDIRVIQLQTEGMTFAQATRTANGEIQSQIAKDLSTYIGTEQPVSTKMATSTFQALRGGHMTGIDVRNIKIRFVNEWTGRPLRVGRNSITVNLNPKLKSWWGRGFGKHFPYAAVGEGLWEYHQRSTYGFKDHIYLETRPSQAIKKIYPKSEQRPYYNLPDQERKYIGTKLVGLGKVAAQLEQIGSTEKQIQLSTQLAKRVYNMSWDMRKQFCNRWIEMGSIGRDWPRHLRKILQGEFCTRYRELHLTGGAPVFQKVIRNTTSLLLSTAFVAITAAAQMDEVKGTVPATRPSRVSSASRS